MASFINQKEEVVQFEFTPYGKHLFSQGKCEPVYYAFYDDDILYDGQRGNFFESQNSTVPRIKETQRVSVQVHYASSVNNAPSNVNVKNSLLQKLTDASAKFFKPLGSNSPWSDYSPSWNINCMEGSKSFKGPYTYRTSLSVPTLSASLDYEYEIRKVQLAPEGESEEVDIFTLVKGDKLVLDVQELNTLFKGNGNYDIEVYKLPDGKDEDIEQLGFINPEATSAGILTSQENPQFFASTLRGSEDQLSRQFPKLDERYVEYYLSGRVDGEIDDVTPGVVNLYSTPGANAPQTPCGDDT